MGFDAKHTRYARASFLSDGLCCEIGVEKMRGFFFTINYDLSTMYLVCTFKIVNFVWDIQ